MRSQNTRRDSFLEKTVKTSSNYRRYARRCFLLIGLWILFGADETVSAQGLYLSDMAMVPPPPMPSFPANGGNNLPSELTLRWNDSPGAESYNVQLADNSDFSKPLADQKGIAGTSIVVNGLLGGTTYHWRIQAVATEGASDWSPVWTFTTAGVAPPSVPLLISPADGAASQDTTLTLHWQVSLSADKYRIQVDDDIDFSSLLVDQGAITDTSLSIRGLQEGENYYWRVQADGEGGASDWSEVWRFVTEETPIAPSPVPGIPILLSPQDGVTDQEVTLSLSWDAVSGADTYEVEVDENPFFSTPLSEWIGLATTSLQIDSLDNDVTYYWRVKGRNTSGAGDWSKVWQFRTVMAAPSPPEHQIPEGEVIQFAISNPTLRWIASNGVLSYRLQVAMGADFSGVVADEDGILENEFTLGELDNATYFWRVQATNAGGASDWSAMRSFIVEVIPPDTIPPAAPIDLDAPEGWRSENSFALTWTNPEEASSIAQVHYKLGAEPEDNKDETDSFPGAGPITVRVEAEGEQRIYVWLEDGEGNMDYRQRATVILRYDSTPPLIPGEITVWSDISRGQSLTEGEWYNHAAPHFEWRGAADEASGVAGYAVRFTHDRDDPVGTETVLQDPAFTVEQPLTQDGTYYLRLRVVDQAGNWSAASTLFTYRFDASPPELVWSPRTTHPMGEAFSVSVLARDDSGINSLVLYYREGNQTSYTALEMELNSDEAFEVTVPGEAVGYGGVAYYIEAGDRAGNRAILPKEKVQSLQVAFQGFGMDMPFPTGIWRMVSVPVQQDDDSPFAVIEVLGLYDISRWRLFRYYQGDYHEFTGVDSSFFEPGKAFWLHLNEPGFEFHSGSGKTVPIDKPFEITLEPGWNDIASPFAFPIRWEDIVSASGDLQNVKGFYAYDGSDWSLLEPADSLIPWEGYAVKNEDDKPVILQIPPLAAENRRKSNAKPSLEEGEWTLQVKVIAGNHRDENNFLGFRSQAHIECDRWDFPEPPPAPVRKVRLYFPRLDWSRCADVYMSDFRPPSEGAVWDFVVEGGDKENSARLFIEGLAFLPAGWNVRLLDVDGGVSIEPSEGSGYPVAIKGPNVKRHWQLVVGRAKYIEQMMGNLRELPGECDLAQNWPNPFNAETVISYQIPHQTQMQLAIYDVLGRRVKVLTDGLQDPGYFTMVWDSRDERELQVASGIYFCVLDTGRERWVRKMTVVR